MGLRVGQSMGVDEFLARFGDKTERYELLDSQPIPRCTGSGAHARIVRRVLGAFRRQLSGRPWRAVERDAAADRPLDLVGAGRHGPVPAPDQACSQAVDPAVVVEVLSGDTQARDRGEKWLKYASLASLQHYLLIASDEQRIEAFSRLDAARWAYRTYQDGLNTTVGLPALDLGLLTAEVYEGVDLDRRAGPRS